ncbi:hypothetical protein [Streptomyces sp. NPDC002851]
MNKIAAKSKRTRRVLIGVLLLAVLGVALPFGYHKIFRSGIDNLPEQPCDGAVMKTTAVEILPTARDVSESSRSTAPGRRFTFNCALTTSDDSILSAWVSSYDSSAETAWKFYSQNIRNQGKPVSVPGNIEARSWSRQTVVYLKCTPPDMDPEDAVEAYSLAVESKIVGESKIHGKALRQALTDFAFQAAEHSFRLAECQEHIKFPKNPPALQ